MSERPASGGNMKTKHKPSAGRCRHMEGMGARSSSNWACRPAARRSREQLSARSAFASMGWNLLKVYALLVEFIALQPNGVLTFFIPGQAGRQHRLVGLRSVGARPFGGGHERRERSLEKLTSTKRRTRSPSRHFWRANCERHRERAQKRSSRPSSAIAEQSTRTPFS